MRHISAIFLVVMTVVVFAGCASDGSLVNPFADNAPAPTQPFYFGEFSDIPIPNEMGESASDTVITASPAGTKFGIQRFKGRVEIASLIATMRQHMTGQGWALRSVFRAKQTILIYEKPDRVCSIYITEGLVYTDMKIYVSQRLDGDASDFGTPMMPVASPAAKPVGRLTE